MSHSVFRDLDNDKSSGNCSKAEVADNNVIVFINKDDIQVNPNALQDLIVNANTNSKSTVSVIRVSSPTPSMKSDEDNSSKHSDDDDDRSDEENSAGSGDSNEERDHSDDNEAQTSKRKKKKKKVPVVSLMVEDFYNPQQAAQFATEIMNLAGFTDPKQLKVDYEHLRYIVQNDHCYTPYTLADSQAEVKSENTDAGKSDTKSSKQTVTSSKKAGRQAQSKPNGLDTSARNRSVDDANSSTENVERSSEEEETESDFSEAEGDSENDRDSDLDFSVNDCHSRRGKKIKKRKIRAKKLAAKKRRQSTLDLNPSDDSSTLNRKKMAKTPRKSLNTSAKMPTAVTPVTSSSVKVTPTSSTKPSPATSSKPSPATSNKPSPAATRPSLAISNKPSPVILNKPSPTPSIKPSLATTSKPSPAATAARITKVTYVKESPPTVNDSVKLSTVSRAPIATATRISNVSSTSVDNKPKNMIVMRPKEKRPENPQTDSSSLFTPDAVKKNAIESPVLTKVSAPLPRVQLNTPPMKVQVNATAMKVNTPPFIKVEATKRTMTPIIVHSISPQVAPKFYQTKMSLQPKIVRPQPTIIVRKATAKPVIKLGSEQDKHLDLIDSLVQEELSKSELDAASSASASQTTIPADIPDIVKMLETSEAPTLTSTAMSAPVTSPSINYSTSQNVNDSQMLPDDLLESFVNSGYLSDDLMQDVVKLVEDKNIQEVIDQQVSLSQEAQPEIISIAAKPNVEQTLMKPPEEPKSIVYTQKMNAPLILNALPISSMNKEPIKVKRADGRIYTLPPIEAPATRGAKRRAEVPASPVHQPKQEVVMIVTAASPQKTPPIIKVMPGSATKAKPIGVRERRASVAVKRASIDSKPRRSMSISNPPPIDDDDDDEEDGSDGSYNSEDDPHRLWCICRTPHNNRFMICCDKCEEWFHGKCVGITRQMGREMEERQSEWICPNCVSKKQPSIKNIFPRKSFTDTLPMKTKEGSSSPAVSQSPSNTSNCIVCGAKPSRVSSVYCSDDCIRKYATTAKMATSPVVSVTEATLKSPTEERKSFQPKITQQLFKDKTNHVVVFDKSTGKYLTGKSAPTRDKLQQWLAEHPQHEVLKPGTPQAMAFKAKQQQLKTLARDMEAEKELFAVSQPAKIQTKLRFEADKMMYVNPSQKQTTPTSSLKRPIPSTGTAVLSPVLKSPATKQEPITKTPKLTATPVQKIVPQKKRTTLTPEAKTPHQNKPESSGKIDQLRSNVRKTITEQLLARTKEIIDPNTPRLTEPEISAFAKAAEVEMFEMFGNDTNQKYKNKYRTLIFNIKDPKNLTLFQKISNKMIEPKQLVRLTTEELASQELAKWRENETKRELEIITKSELDMLALGNSYVLKTHKGEEVIQDSGERIATATISDLESVLNSATVSSSDAPALAKDNRMDKYLSPEGKGALSSSAKRDSDRSHEKKDRHDSRSTSSSKHKRKRSRERHSSHAHSHSHKDRDKSHDRERKDRSSTSKDKKDHKSTSSSSSSSSSRSKHHSDKRKRESIGTTHSAPKIQKTDDNSIHDKILKAQSTIDSILHSTEPKHTPSTANASATTMQPAANESDQEPTSTVSIPSPTEGTPESSTPPPLTKTAFLWSGSMSMVDVATFKMSLSLLSGSAAMIEFPKEFDVVGRIGPEIVWDYLEKIRITKDIVLLRFSPLSSSDDKNAYSTFINYLDVRNRLGVIKVPSKVVKDFYIMPLTSHKSLPPILKTSTGYDMGADRPDLLLGIIVRNRISQTPIVPAPIVKHRSTTMLSHKPLVTSAVKEAHYTPPSSPNVAQAHSITKQVMSSFPNMDDDEPYSPGGSDEDDPALSTIPTSSYLSSIPDYSKTVAPAAGLSQYDREKLKELERQIEMEKMEIAMHLKNNIDEPYSPTNSVSPPINTNLSDVAPNISIPVLTDILKNVGAFGSSSQPYTTMDTSDNEYVPGPATSATIYAPTQMSSQPSKLAQLTDEELMRLVPDEID